MSDVPHDDQTTIGRRSNSRARLYLPARLESLSGVQPAEINNLSVGGAMITVAAPPKAGGNVILRYGSVEAFCDVVWVRGCQCGLSFEDDMSEADVLAARQESDELPRIETERRRQFAQAWVNGSSPSR